jgi:TatD DNase family protein
MLIDSHCHLDFPDFAEDFDGVLARAAAAGVGAMVTISTRVREFRRYANLAERHANIWCTVGTHPHQAGNETDVTVEELVTLSAHPRCVGIGEAGLDYFYDKAPRDLQRKSLLIHIDAARRTGLPLVIHARDADDDMAAILTEEMGKGAFKAILHCFSSGAALARTGVALGLYVSFSGILTFRNSQALRDIAAELPADRLLVETDAPYLAPVPHRGKRNEPAFVAHTARVLAEVRGLDIAALMELTAANTRRVFAKMDAS